MAINNLKKLQEYDDLYSYRIGDYRVRYKLEGSEECGYIGTFIAIGHRKIF